MPDDAVWNGTLDNRYTVTVIRTGTYHGELSIREGDQILLRENVGLSYDARFGPDAGDVADWQQRAVEFTSKPGAS
jgi:hypothetical protein